MTPSTVTLRIEEFVAENDYAALSQATKISEETIWRYAKEKVELTDKSAADIRSISAELDVPVVELVKPIVKREAVRLKIREIALHRGLTLEKLSEASKVHLLIIEFYSKRPIYKEKILEAKSQDNLNKICNILGCEIEELLVEIQAKDLPETKLRLEEFAEDRGLNLNDLSLLTELPPELIDLLATQPIDTSSLFFDDNATPEDYIFRPSICKYFRGLLPRSCSS